ncbi:hypothetical protein Q6A90_04860 [Aliarcobacter skirrowii]|nr:hypothetical protein [Aliarcobacter skirrowii]MDX4061692.1 hypothetical protein [Aliarcobacter skirrowii]
MENGIKEVHDSLEKLNGENIQTNQTLEDIKILLEKILEKLEQKS